MKQDTKNWVLLLILSCVWGSSFILMKRGMFTLNGDAIFSDSQVAALRISIAGIVLLPFALKSLKQIQSFREFLLLAIVGLCGNFFPAYLFTFAETGVSSGYAGMLNSFTPIFSMIIGLLIFKNKLTPIQLLGLFIGTIGIVLLVLSGNSNDLKMTGSSFHVFAIVLATLFYAISLNTIKYTLQKFKAIEITALALFIVLIPSILSAIQLDTLSTIQTNPNALEGLGFIAVLSIVGTALALLLFNQLISSSSTLFASSVTYFIPIVAVFIGVGFGEGINIAQVGAMLLVLLGVFIANYWNSIFKTKKNETLL